jgi:cytochrome c5
MKNIFLSIAALIVGFSSASAFPMGEKTYRQVCMVCHTSGVGNAPKIGDNARWAPLIAEGQVIITAHGYVGVRAMPPKGGKPDLSIADFSAAINYMVNQSGGDWKTPEINMMIAIKEEIIARELTQKSPKK